MSETTTCADVPQFTITIPRGARRLIDFEILKADGTPQDITGQTIVLVARTSATAPDPPAIEETAEITDGAAGKCRVTIDHDESLALKAPATLVACLFRDSIDDEDVLGEGALIVKHSIRYAPATS